MPESYLLFTNHQWPERDVNWVEDLNIGLASKHEMIWSTLDTGIGTTVYIPSAIPTANCMCIDASNLL